MLNSIVDSLEAGHGVGERLVEVARDVETRYLVVVTNGALLYRNARGGVNGCEPTIVGGLLSPIEHAVGAKRHRLELVVGGQRVALTHLCGFARKLVELEEITIFGHGVEVAVVVGSERDQGVVHQSVVAICCLWDIW